MFVLSNDLKYTLNKHKSKILIGSSIVLFGAIGTGVYFLVTDGDLFGGSGDNKQEFKLAKYMVSGNNQGNLQLVEIDSGKTVDRITLPKGTYLYTLNNSYDKVYAYDGKNIYSYAMKRGHLKEEGKIAEIKTSKATKFRVEDKNIAILSNDGQTLTYRYGVEDKVKEKKWIVSDNVTDFHIQDGTLYYSSDTKLYAFSPKSETSIELGDITDVITTFQDHLLIHNQFGSGLDNNILVSLQKDNLKINNLQKTESSATHLIPMDEGDTTFYTTQYVNTSEPYNLLVSWQLKDGKLVKNNDVAVKIPVKKDGITYDAETTVGSDGYLYTHFHNKTQIFDVRSREVLKNVKVDDYFAMPVLNN